MLSDGIQDRHAESEMAVRDVAQILLESIEFHPESSAATNGNGSSGDYPQTKPVEETTGEAVGPGAGTT
jgi:hypothetical protein